MPVPDVPEPGFWWSVRFNVLLLLWPSKALAMQEAWIEKVRKQAMWQWMALLRQEWMEHFAKTFGVTVEDAYREHGWTPPKTTA